MLDHSIRLCFIVATTTLACSGPAALGTEYPRRPIKVIVPFGAGGGSDTFGRIIQNAIESHELLPQPFVIINVPGAGGTIGSRRVKHARPDGYTLLLLHEGILTAKHSGQAAYGPEAFEPIIGTGNATQVIAVAADSPHADLRSLVQAATSKPDTIVFAANIGAPSYFAGLMLEDESDGAKFRYTQSGGGAKRFAAIQGGHVDVSAFSIAEYVQFKSSGMRALAILAAERNSDLPELATALEQGYDVLSQNMQFWWAPAGTPQERTDVIANAIERAMVLPEVQQRFAQMRMEPIALRNAELVQEIRRRDEKLGSVAPEATIELPDFPAMVFAAVVLLAIVAFVRSQSRRVASSAGVKEPNREERWYSGHMIGVGVLVIAYVASLQVGVGFVPTTALFGILSGAILVRPKVARGQITVTRASVAILGMVFMVSVVMYQLFTRILVVDLP